MRLTRVVITYAVFKQIDLAFGIVPVEKVAGMIQTGYMQTGDAQIAYGVEYLIKAFILKCPRMDKQIGAFNRHDSIPAGWALPTLQREDFEPCLFIIP